eukprot:SAG11_NODE_9032_length_951_cov_1.207746_2_plen_31_part_01
MQTTPLIPSQRRERVILTPFAHLSPLVKCFA